MKEKFKVREGMKIMRNKPGTQQENRDNGNVVVKNRLVLDKGN